MNIERIVAWAIGLNEGTNSSASGRILEQDVGKSNCRDEDVLSKSN